MKRNEPRSMRDNELAEEAMAVIQHGIINIHHDTPILSELVRRFDAYREDNYRLRERLAIITEGRQDELKL